MGEKEKKKTVALSKRMRMLADMVTAGNDAADVGCDHAFLSIYLVQTKKCPRCLAMDVRKGPLSGAREHIVSYGLGEYIETRLSDGLTAYRAGEAKTLICAGMGGRLMERILSEGGEKARSFSELILQPQSEIPEFRAFLRKENFLITEESAVYEEGKYYFAMKAVYKEQVLSAENRESVNEQNPEINMLYDLYGKSLLKGRHPVLKQYLLYRRNVVDGIIIQLQKKDTVKSEKRLKELYLEQEQLRAALEFFDKEGSR